jgi:hypothetical protein
MQTIFSFHRRRNWYRYHLWLYAAWGSSILVSFGLSAVWIASPIQLLHRLRSEGHMIGWLINNTLMIVAQ